MEDDFVEIDLDITGEVLPESNDLVALIDADTLAYTACLSVEVQEPVLPKEFYTDEEYTDLMDNPDYDEDNHCIWVCNPDESYTKAVEKLQKIFDKTGCRTAEMYFTGGKEYFRYKIFPEYKGNRKYRRPPAGLFTLKNRLAKEFNGSICTDYESDDLVVYLKEKYPEKYLLVALDKDVYNSVVGTHFNYYESMQYNIEMKFVTVDEETKMKWPFMQAMVGDVTDNIKGIKGIGKVKAFKLLSDCSTEQECWKVVLTQYLIAGQTQQDAETTMRLVDMHQFDGEKIVLWEPKC